MEKVERFIGKITWIEGDVMKYNPGGEHLNAEIIRGIKGDGYFNIEYGITEGDEGGLVKLTTKNGIDFVGSLYRNSDKNPAAKIVARFFFNANEAILFGTWVEETWVYTSVFDLKSVNEF